MKFDPQPYWEDRLGTHLDDLRGVGQMGRSDLFNHYYYRAKTRALDRAIGKVGLDLKSDGVRMLDVGTGTGFWVDHFLGKGIKSIVGIDIAANAIESLKVKHAESSDLEFRCEDISESEFSDGDGFEFIVAMDTLFHLIEDAKFSTAISNLAGALKPGGFLFLTDSLSASGDIVDSPPYIRWRGLAEYEDALKQAGLTLVYMAPKTVLLLNQTADAGTPIARLLNMVYFRLTVRLTSSEKIPPSIKKAYLALLYRLDSVCTLISPLSHSTKILVAKKDVK